MISMETNIAIRNVRLVQVNAGFVDLHATFPVLQEERLTSRVPIGRTLIVPTGPQRWYDLVDSKAEENSTAWVGT